MTFEKAELGKAAANRMYSSGVDIIFHAAGGTGNGVFAEAKERKKADPNANVWVIGVDSDQYEEGQVGDDNITLTSMLKRVDIAVKNIAELAAEGEFPGGEMTTLRSCRRRYCTCGFTRCNSTRCTRRSGRIHEKNC